VHFMCVGFSFNYTKKFFYVTLNIEFAYYKKYIKGKEIKKFSLSHRITKKGEGHFNNKQIWCARALVFIILVLVIIIIIIIVASKL
jgi:hypothetical protein